jgi:hypothetical protein
MATEAQRRDIEIQEYLRIARSHLVVLVEDGDRKVRGVPEADLDKLVTALLKAIDRLRPGPPVVPVRQMRET